MTDTDLIAAIRKIIGTRVRNGDRSAAERDLAKYDQIVGLLQRNPPEGNRETV